MLCNFFVVPGICNLMSKVSKSWSTWNASNTTDTNSNSKVISNRIGSSRNTAHLNSNNKSTHCGRDEVHVTWVIKPEERIQLEDIGEWHPNKGRWCYISISLVTYFHGGIITRRCPGASVHALKSEKDRKQKQQNKQKPIQLKLIKFKFQVGALQRWKIVIGNRWTTTHLDTFLITPI